MIKEASRVDLTHEQDAPTPKKPKYAALELEKMDITYAEEVVNLVTPLQKVNLETFINH